ncbi:MAG: hypothetical protein ACYSWO_00145 [Planctomycetota bacterium]|jgi:hypothetical protein
MNRKNTNRAAIIFSILLSVVVFIVMLDLRDPLNRPLPIVWNTDRASDVPLRFAYLMFPRSNSVNIIEETSEAVIAPLQRAMMHRESELHASKYISVMHENGKGRVLLSDLSFLPAPEFAEQQIDNWKKVLVAFGQWRSADIKFQKTSDAQTEVTLLTISNDGGRNQYLYRTDGVAAEAIEWRGLTDAGGSMRALGALVVSGLSALIVFVLSWVFLKLIVKRYLSHDRPVSCRIGQDRVSKR